MTSTSPGASPSITASELPPILSVVGRKNSGKTTLLVHLAAELRRRGLRIATVKHGHHAFSIDHPGTDSWRHLHEGGAEAVLLIGGSRLALVMECPDGEPEPLPAIQHAFGGRGYDLILVEGYKHGPFPKIEIVRSAVHDQPVAASSGGSGDGASTLAIVTDVNCMAAAQRIIPLAGDPVRGSHVIELADLAQAFAARAAG